MLRKLTEKLKAGLQKTRDRILGGLRNILPFGRELSDQLIEEMEEHLLTADIGPRTVEKIMTRIREAWRRREVRTTDECYDLLRRHLREMLLCDAQGLLIAPTPPTVILVAGVNGSGKTTSIAKLAWRLKEDGRRVMVAAADTFRAAAVEQLALWSERIGVDIVRQKTGADPAAVAFDAVEAALARGVDCLIVDTAGRLHTQDNLMKELEKIRRVIGKRIPGAPHEVLLVLDGTTGQNAIQQAEQFRKLIDVTGLFVTKLDGTAKGGAIIGIRDQIRIPIKFIGVGEKPSDIETFDAEAFVDALFA